MLGDEAAGMWRWPPTFTWAEVKERAQMYFYSPHVLSWQVIEWTFTFFILSFPLAWYTFNKKVSCCYRRFLTSKWTLWRAHCIAHCVSHTHAPSDVVNGDFSSAVAFQRMNYENCVSHKVITSTNKFTGFLFFDWERKSFHTFHWYNGAQPLIMETSPILRLIT